MSFYQTLQQATAQEREHLFNAPIIEACRRGDISRDTYLAFLAQAYYHVRHTVPLLMAPAASWVRSTSGCVAPLPNTSTRSMAIRSGS